MQFYVAFYVLFIFRLVHVFSQNLLPGGVLPNKEVRGACRLTSGLEAKFGVRSGQVHKIRGKIWEVLSPKDTKVGKKYQFWGQYLKFRGQNLGYLSFIFLEANLGLQQEFQRQNLGPSPPPPRPPNMEIPPWEFTSGVKDMTFVLTYIWFIIENGLLDRIHGWFYYVFIKPSFFHMIVDDRYDRWDRCDRWNIRWSLWSSQLLKFDFHIVAGIVQIAGHIRLLWSSRSLRSLCCGFHMIAGIVTIAAVAALVVSINFLRSLTIVHDRYDRYDRRGRLWFYPSDRDRCDRWQSLKTKRSSPKHSCLLTVTTFLPEKALKK